MTSSTDDLVQNIAEKRELQDLTERDMLEATAIAQTLTLERTHQVRLLRPGFCREPAGETAC